MKGLRSLVTHLWEEIH